MGEELSLLTRKLLPEYQDYVSDNYECDVGHYNDDIEFAIVGTGIGKVNAGVGAQITIDRFKPDIMINVGVAGSVSEFAEVLDLVIGTSYVYHDVYATQFGYDKGQVPRMPNKYSSDSDLFKIITELLVRDMCSIVCTGTVATGDQFVDTLDDKIRIREDFHAIVVDMEAAAYAQVCYINDTPFISVKVVSDSCDNESVNYSKVLEDASEKYSDLIIKLLDNIWRYKKMDNQNKYNVKSFNIDHTKVVAPYIRLADTKRINDVIIRDRKSVV